MSRHENKVSYGVACVRRQQGLLQVLLVKSRCTYAYINFVLGKYTATSDDAMVRMFNQMTADEKIDIRSRTFLMMWYRLWLDSMPKSYSFYGCRSKFEANFAVDGGERLLRLLAASTRCGKCVWEIPKGRKKSERESPINCGLREFVEETGMNVADIRLYPDITFGYTFVDDIRYTYKYYLAWGDGRIVPNIKSAVEVAESRWMNLEEIKYHGSAELYACAGKIFRWVRRNLRPERCGQN
jgi:8-oxo-dGTP pyrophosphatase MutT (NUDIX family)